MDRSRDLYRRTVEAIGVKKYIAATGLSMGHVYRCMRSPMDVENPDGTGADRIDWDRFVLTMELLHALPDEKPLLMEWELEARELFGRLLRHEVPRLVTHEALLAIVAKCAKEAGEATAEALTAGNRALAIQAATEASQEYAKLAATLSAAHDAENTLPLRRPA